MNTVETILVVLLSAGFLILIILSIILISLLIAVMRNVRRISQRAEEVTFNIADITANLSRKIAPIAASAVVAAVMKRFKGKN